MVQLRLSIEFDFIKAHLINFLYGLYFWIKLWIPLFWIYLLKVLPKVDQSWNRFHTKDVWVLKLIGNNNYRVLYTMLTL